MSIKYMTLRYAMCMIVLIGQGHFIKKLSIHTHTHYVNGLEGLCIAEKRRGISKSSKALELVSKRHMTKGIYLHNKIMFYLKTIIYLKTQVIMSSCPEYSKST